MSRVYFVGSRYHGCNYVRCLLPMWANGWDGSIRGIGKREKPLKNIMQEIQAADVVVFHRADTVEHHKIGKMLRDMGKKIVFDNDDTYKKTERHPFYMLDEKNFEQNKTFKNNLINNFILNADLVTCTTEALAKEYKDYNPNVVVLPNCIDPFDWDEPLRNEGDKVRIGIVGSTAYNHDFEHVQDYILELSKRPDVQLVLYGLHSKEKKEGSRLVRRVLRKEYAFWDKIDNLEHTEWCEMDKYFQTLNNLKLDLMIIPRGESDFNKAKSNIKFLEAGMCEIPVIAQSFSTNDSPYDNDINGENGILIKDNSKWMEETVRLIENKEIRREMGRKAKEYVLANYDIKDHAHKWVDAYNKLLTK